MSKETDAAVFEEMERQMRAGFAVRAQSDIPEIAAAGRSVDAIVSSVKWMREELAATEDPSVVMSALSTLISTLLVDLSRTVVNSEAPNEVEGHLDVVRAVMTSSYRAIEHMLRNPDKPLDGVDVDKFVVSRN